LALDDYSLVARLLRRESGNKATDHHVLWEVTCDLFHSTPSLFSFLLFTSAPPLTVENILSAVQGVAWRKLGEELIYHSWEPEYPKLEEIESQHQSDDSRLRAVIECWLQGEGRNEEPSWRRIIWALDGATEDHGIETIASYPGPFEKSENKATETSAAADPIRHFAEPLPGKSCDSITFLYSVTCLTSDSVHTNSRRV